MPENVLEKVAEQDNAVLAIKVLKFIKKSSLTFSKVLPCPLKKKKKGNNHIITTNSEFDIIFSPSHTSLSLPQLWVN